jgi:lysylphosphatidylglycerol synthetase-like protein (DUF2156 family)
MRDRFRREAATHGESSGAGMLQSRSEPEQRQLSIGFWLAHIGLPAALLTAALMAGYAGGAVKELVLGSHTSVQESVTGALIFAAAVIGALALFRSARPLDWTLKVWLALFVAAMIFFVGEDLNWGQHYLGRTPSDFFLEHNREQESNLHNMWPSRRSGLRWRAFSCPWGGGFRCV